MSHAASASLTIIRAAIDQAKACRCRIGLCQPCMIALDDALAVLPRFERALAVPVVEELYKETLRADVAEAELASMRGDLGRAREEIQQLKAQGCKEDLIRCEACGLVDDAPKAIHPCDNCTSQNWSKPYNPFDLMAEAAR